MSSRQRRVSVAVVALCSFVAVVSVRTADNGAGYAEKEWPAPGGDWASTRYSMLAQINKANIRQLGGEWVVDLPDRQVSKAPLMVKDGRMIVTTSQGTIL